MPTTNVVVRCFTCQQLNRVSLPVPLGERVQCGACKRVLASLNPADPNDDGADDRGDVIEDDDDDELEDDDEAIEDDDDDA